MFDCYREEVRERGREWESEGKRGKERRREGVREREVRGE